MSHTLPPYYKITILILCWPNTNYLISIQNPHNKLLTRPLEPSQATHTFETRDDEAASDSSDSSRFRMYRLLWLRCFLGETMRLNFTPEISDPRLSCLSPTLTDFHEERWGVTEIIMFDLLINLIKLIKLMVCNKTNIEFIWTLQ